MDLFNLNNETSLRDKIRLVENGLNVQRRISKSEDFYLFYSILFKFTVVFHLLYRIRYLNVNGYFESEEKVFKLLTNPVTFSLV